MDFGVYGTGERCGIHGSLGLTRGYWTEMHDPKVDAMIPGKN